MSKKEYHNKICPICEREFKPQIHNQIYCSKHCYKIAMNIRRRGEPQYGICPVCGKKFKLNVYNQIYCSPECKKIHYEKNKIKNMVKYKNCPICGSIFELTTPNKIYCSVECRNKANRRIIYKKCERCGREFELKSSNQKYCCKRCAKDAVNDRYRVGFKPKNCKKCGSIFMPTSSRSIYCNNCRDVALKENKKNGAKKYERNKRRNDINHKIKCWCRNQIYRCINFDNNITRKNKHTFDILNYTPNQLKQRLESQFKNGMTWENIGTHWEIHHKKELSRFNFILPDGTPNYRQMSIANALSNLQPLTIEEHKRITAQFNKKG